MNLLGGQYTHRQKTKHSPLLLCISPLLSRFQRFLPFRLSLLHPLQFSFLSCLLLVQHLCHSLCLHDSLRFFSLPASLFRPLYDHPPILAQTMGAKNDLQVPLDLALELPDLCLQLAVLFLHLTSPFHNYDRIERFVRHLLQQLGVVLLQLLVPVHQVDEVLAALALLLRALPTALSNGLRQVRDRLLELLVLLVLVLLLLLLLA